MRPPAFWDADAPRGSARLFRALLSPAGALYAGLVARRIRRTTPVRAGAPVICIGNLTLGGVGKTPVARAVLDRLVDAGRTPFALSRGYGGSQAGPLRVDPAQHDAHQVGDEPLMLAERHRVVVARDRPAGAALAVQQGADVIVMDDGHQNPSLAKDLSLLVVDAQTGWGAGKVFPAGPLREPVSAGLARAHAVILMKPFAEFQPDWRALGLDRLEKPVLSAWLEPAEPAPEGPLFAFAGIGRPQKFFDALTAAGGELAETAAFPDHHAYAPRELETLASLARAHGARLITTEKDAARLPAPARARTLVFPVRAAFAEPARLDALLETCLESHPS